MGATTKTILLASAALAALAVPALANSYFFRTKPLVDPPQAFALAAVSGATPGAVTESAPVKLSGYRGKTASVSGGEYQICSVSNCSDQGSSWKTAATANLGADVYARVRVTAAAYGQTATARLAVGDAASNFDVASRAKDTTPDAFSFAPKPGLEVGVPAYSDSTLLTAFDGAPLSVSGGGYQICSTVACTEMDGRPLQTAAIAEAQPGTRLRLVAIPATYGATATATLTVGNVVGSFSATARAKDETPDPITFTAKVDQTAGESVDSEIRQLVNHDGVTVSVSGAGASYRVCSDSACSGGSPAFTTASGAAARNAWVQVRQVAPAGGTEAVASLSYGTLTAAFSVKSANGNYIGAYATATEDGGTRKLAFVYLPPNTAFTSNADYKAFCESKGFDQNQFRDSRSFLEGTGMVDPTAYYFPSACNYLGQGNSGAQKLSGFQNFGLPLNTGLRVRDRGCGNYGGSFSTGQNTSDKLTVTGSSTMTFTNNGFGPGDLGTTKATSFADEGVIVCQTKN